MQHIILEIGCGSCEIARQIAGRNPGWGVIATDLYDSDEPGNATGSRYQRVTADLHIKVENSDRSQSKDFFITPETGFIREQ